jgi:solute:Na+ symporter, SSS family
MIILFSLRVKPAAVATGLLTGQILAIILYILHIDLGGFNLGLLCLVVNIAVTAVLNYGSRRKPVHALS